MILGHTNLIPWIAGCRWNLAQGGRQQINEIVQGRCAHLRFKCWDNWLLFFTISALLEYT
jgi:hypothetical protein